MGKKAGNARKGDRPMRQGRDKGERVWHVAASEEECGDVNTTFHQSHEKPHDLCTEVNVTISVCTTRDTEVLKSKPNLDMRMVRIIIMTMMFMFQRKMLSGILR